MGTYNTTMYVFASQLVGKAVISLQVGGLVAIVSDFVVNADMLELVAFRCFAPDLDLVDPILFLRDTREIGSDCILVDSVDALASLEDVVRIKQIVLSGFHLAGTKVFTEAGSYLGKVEDFTINFETRRIHRLTIQPQLLRRFMSETLLIDREQIVDVTKDRITVREATVKESKRVGIGATMPTE